MHASTEGRATSEDDRTMTEGGSIAGTRVVRPREPHVELLDTVTNDVWMSLEPVSPERNRALRVDLPLLRIAQWTGAMDRSTYHRSPGADADGPLETRDFDGILFVRTARPDFPAPDPAPGYPHRVEVAKHQTIEFDAGREVLVLTLPHGETFLHVIEPPADDERERSLPPGWTVEARRLNEPLVVRLPEVTTVFFWPNGESFQGPVQLG
jgi:hypothetical protein